MTTRRRLFYRLLLGAVVTAVWSGCASDPFGPRIIFPNATVNGQPERLAMDTGASMNWLYASEAGRLGLQSTPIPKTESAPETARGLSDPAGIAVGAQTYTAPLATIGVPWIIRLLSGISGRKDIVGAFGWPAVRDNILVFDAAHRMVRAVGELPPETAGWVKLKMKANRSDGLFLEIPTGAGPPRTFLVDTGDPGGVTLSPRLWEKWRAGHPHAHTATAYGWFLGRTKPERRQTAQADDVELGPLTLTNVSLCRQSSYETDLKIHDGTFGLEALERMDLVVDGKNGFAYARPAPPLAGAAPRRDHLEWIAGGTVRLDVAPQLIFAANMHGSIKQGSGDHAGAVADFTRALELDPQNIRIYSDRALARENSGDHAGAIADATRASEIDSRNASLYTLRGTAHQNKGEYDLAITDFDRAIALAPGKAGAHIFRGMARLSKGDAAGAIADANRALELEPAETAPYSVRGMAEFAKADFDGAIADLTRALKADPANASLYAVRGGAKLEKSDQPGAITDFHRAFEIDPQTSSGRFSIGTMQQREGNYTGALVEYEKAIALNVGDATDARLFRQLLLRRLGRPAEDFSKFAAGWRDGWKKTLARFVTGGLSENELLAEADQGDKKDQANRECDAFYCIGMMRFIRGDKAGAREFWQKCGTPEHKNSLTAQLAVDELARLDGQLPAG